MRRGWSELEVKEKQGAIQPAFTEGQAEEIQQYAQAMMQQSSQH